jgi:hypothetical protein
MYMWPYLIFLPCLDPFCFIAPKTLNYLPFQISDFERTWWWLFQKGVVHTEIDIYV